MLALITRIAPDAFHCVLTAPGHDGPVYEATRSGRTRALDAALAGAGLAADVDFTSVEETTSPSGWPTLGTMRVELRNVRPSAAACRKADAAVRARRALDTYRVEFTVDKRRGGAVRKSIEGANLDKLLARVERMDGFNVTSSLLVRA